MDSGEFSEQLTSFRGFAKISLHNFDFKRVIPGVRAIHENHVLALLQTFKSEGCQRLDPDNYVKVILPEDVLQQSLHQQGLSEHDLHGEHEPHHLELPEGGKATVLQGKH